MAMITNTLLLTCCFLIVSTLISLPSLLSATTVDVEQTTLARRETLANPATTNKQFLNAHNIVRAKHNLPPLMWNDKLAKFAKWYANTRKSDCALVHSSSNLGENIFWGEGKQWKVANAVAAWAVQENYYNYQSNTCMPNKDCLHYTQMVWRSTKYLGCAKTKCNNGDTYVVCEYYPHGNIIGLRPY